MSLGIVARTKLEKDIDLSVTSALVDEIVEQGSKTSDIFGARPMRRAVQYILEDAISDAIIRCFLVAGDSATLDFQECDNKECNVAGMRSF